MTRMPISWRLILWFSLILCAILVVSGITVSLMLNHYLINEIDDGLRVHSARVHGTLNPKQVPEELDYNVLHSKLPPINEIASPGLFIQFVDAGGNIVMKSQNLGNGELPVTEQLAEAGLAGNVSIHTVTVDDGTRLRLMVSPMYLSGQTLLLIVGKSLTSFDSAMSNVRLALIIGISLALLLSATSAAFVVRQALSPVRRITNTVKNIEEKSDLTQRVRYDGPSDEIGQLALTFNHMIEHLQQVFQSQKRFVADASHDMRIPLTIIKGNHDLLARNPDRPDRMEALKAIGTETERMMNIATSLLTLAGIESAETDINETVSLGEIINEEYQRATRAADKRNIRMISNGDLYIKGNKFKIKRLLGDLVDNALKYTPDRGTVTMSLFRDDGCACLQVADTGIGISPEHMHISLNRFTDRIKHVPGTVVG